MRFPFLIAACAVLSLAACDRPAATSAEKPAEIVAKPVDQRAIRVSETDYQCGDQRVTFQTNSEYEHTAGLQIKNVSYAMEHVASDTGMKYQNLGSPDTVFWLKGKSAVLTVKGKEFPECHETTKEAVAKPVSPDGIRNIVWVLEDLNKTGVMDNAHVTLTFDEKGRLHGRGGCNQYGGSYEMKWAKLAIKPNMMSTMMACAPALMELEQRYTALLPTMTKVAVTDTGALVLTSEDGSTLSFMPEG